MLPAAIVRSYPALPMVCAVDLAPAVGLISETSTAHTHTNNEHCPAETEGNKLQGRGRGAQQEMAPHPDTPGRQIKEQAAWGSCQPPAASGIRTLELLARPDGAVSLRKQKTEVPCACICELSTAKACSSSCLPCTAWCPPDAAQLHFWPQSLPPGASSGPLQ